MLSSYSARGLRAVRVHKRMYSAAQGEAKQDPGHKRRILSIHPEALYKSVRVTGQLRETQKIAPKVHDWLNGTKVAEMMREWQGYHRYGLRHDDLWVEFPYVQEALLRLPKSEMIERTNRIREALVANSQARQLPEDQWTKPEEDTPYLSPYIQEVQREWCDRAAFRTRVPTTMDSLFNLVKPKL